MMDPANGQGTGAVRASHGPDKIQLYPDSGADADYQVRPPGRARLFFHATGAVLSLSLIGMGGWWGYKQIMRDMHGVPVVRALEGPMRIAPDDPGGLVANHAGLSVNAVQAIGVASAPEASLILAPEPISLTDDDLPASELAPAKPETTTLATNEEADDAELVLADPVEPQAASLTEDVPPSDPVSRALALAEATTAGAVPLSEPAVEGIEAAVETAALAGPVGPGLPRSPRPAPRPARSAVPISAPAISAQPTVAVPVALDASTVPAGTRLVQLGAFDSPEDATTAWTGIANRFDTLMEDKQKIILEATAGGRSFWRLRAMGFADLSEARRFCAALVAERTDCIPVVAR